jgi:hypothetical protein
MRKSVKSAHRFFRISLIVTMALISAAVAGCRPKESAPTSAPNISGFGEGGETVSGSITFGGKKIPVGMIVFFKKKPSDPGPRFAIGNIAMGKYRAEHVPAGEVTVAVLTSLEEMEEMKQRIAMIKLDPSSANRENLRASQNRRANGVGASSTLPIVPFSQQEHDPLKRLHMSNFGSNPLPPGFSPSNMPDFKRPKPEDVPSGFSMPPELTSSDIAIRGKMHSRLEAHKMDDDMAAKLEKLSDGDKELLAQVSAAYGLGTKSTHVAFQIAAAQGTLDIELPEEK